MAVSRLLTLKIDCYQNFKVVSSKKINIRENRLISSLLWYLKEKHGLDGTLYFRSQNIGYKKKSALDKINIQDGDTLDLKRYTMKNPNQQKHRIKFLPSGRYVEMALPPNITFESLQFIIECEEKVMVEHQHITWRGKKWDKESQHVCTKEELEGLIVQDTSTRINTPHEIKENDKPLPFLGVRDPDSDSGSDPDLTRAIIESTATNEQVANPGTNNSPNGPEKSGDDGALCSQLKATNRRVTETKPEASKISYEPRASNITSPYETGARTKIGVQEKTAGSASEYMQKLTTTSRGYKELKDGLAVYTNPPKNRSKEDKI